MIGFFGDCIAILENFSSNISASSRVICYALVLSRLPDGAGIVRGLRFTQINLVRGVKVPKPTIILRTKFWKYEYC